MTQRRQQSVLTLAFGILVFLITQPVPVHAFETSDAGNRVDEDAWTDNVENAIATAKKTDRDLLLFFTGSDWCPPCKKLEEEVFSHEDFTHEATSKFVLVILDFPQNKTLLPHLELQNKEWALRFGVESYPTVILMDHQRRPFAITGYAPGGVEPFLGLMGEARQKRIRRDEFLVNAKELAGHERAIMLDKAMSEMDEDIVNLYYEDIVKEMVELDKDDSHGLRTKWNSQKDSEMRKMIMTDIVTISRLEKPEKAIKFIDEVLGAIEFAAEQKLQIYQIRLGLLKKTGQRNDIDQMLDTMIAMEELTPKTRERLIVKKAFVWAGTDRKSNAIKLIDDSLRNGDGDLYLLLAKGQLLSSDNKHVEAIESFDEGIRHARSDPDVFIELIGAKADSLVAHKDSLAAIKALDVFADDKQMPTELRGEALLHKALIMRETGRRRQARLAENRAVEIAETPALQAEMQKLVDRLRRRFDTGN